MKCKPNVALIGFMGTGKTVIGKQLAKRLDKKFIDTDSLIENQAGKSIPLLFAEEGELRFRELEIRVIKQVSGLKDVVIACGGGIVLNKINIDYLQRNALITLLKASPETILERVESDGEERPLLHTSNKLKKIKELLSYRKPFYERAAELTIETSFNSVDDVVDEIIRKINSGTR